MDVMANNHSLGSSCISAFLSKKIFKTLPSRALNLGMKIKHKQNIRN